MAHQPTNLILKKPIPPQIVNEGATFGPLNLHDFVDSLNPEGGKVYYRAELSNGEPLPKGLICTTEGLINGIAGAGTHGIYKVLIVVVNDETDELSTEFDFTIKPRPVMDEGHSDEPDLFKKLKAEVWEALGKDLPLPEMKEILNRPITKVELYYLLQRFATLTIWDVYNLDYPHEKRILQLDGVSKHYEVYDRGSCIVGAPKDLFSHERTPEDILQTAKAMAREVYKRGWVIEFAGFEKMVRGAWVELQLLGNKNGKHLEILHFSPTDQDVKIYSAEAEAKSSPTPASGMERF
jgi:hypothetical protein